MSASNLDRVAVPDRRRTDYAVLAASALAAAAAYAVPSASCPAVVSALAAALGVVVALSLRDRREGRREAASARISHEALRAVEGRFGFLADHAGGMIVETDRCFVHRYVSPGSLRLLGYRPEELLGASAMDILHPEDVEACRAALGPLLDGGCDDVVMVRRHRHADGRTVWTESRVRATRDPASGAVAGCLIASVEVTDRREAEKALQSSEAFLRGVIDASPDCIQVLDLDGQITFMSRNGLCLLDLEDSADVVSRDFVRLWPPEHRNAVRSALSAAAAGASMRFRARCMSAKGRPLHLDVVIGAIRGADGRPERLLAISRDVTASSDAEAALRQAQDLYRLLAENSSDVVMLREPGPDGRAHYVSPSAARVLGCTPDEVAGQGCGLVHPDDRPVVRALLKSLKLEDGTVLHTHRMRRSDGTYVWVEGAFQVAEQAGEPTVVVALRDVTERQQRAEDLAAAKELAERAQRSAEGASRAKSDFLAAMSHEIRTPLNSIIGFTDLMIDAGDLPAAAARHAELIRASGGALLTVVNDVLDFSKVEAGAVELEAIPFSPAELARQCAAILGGYAGTKSLDIAVELGERLPASLVGDEGRLRQVLLNLLNNAVKFTPRGRVVLSVTGLGSAGGGEAIRFAVADTGIGIPAAKQHRLFERFSQVDSSVARRFGGSGLGLAICKKLVELMGGEIGVRSREGEGSTFWFSVVLPAAAVPALPPAPAPRADPSRAARILVVEDIDINQRLAVALLEAGGHAVDVVADGAQAVAAVAERRYDLVLMDVQMPGMDGVTATRLIRASAGPHRAVPIVAMTANVFPEQIRAVREAGMDGHLGKPLARAQLLAAVDRWADKGGAAPAPGAERCAEAFDATAFAELAGHLGPARLDDVLARFVDSVPARFAPGSDPIEDVRRWRADAHVVVSVAGMAGFSDLANRARELETALPFTARYAATLAAARAARDAAVTRAVDLRRGLATTGAEPAA